MFVKPTRIGEFPTTWRAFPKRDWEVNGPVKDIHKLDPVAAMYAALYNECVAAWDGNEVAVDTRDLHEGNTFVRVPPIPDRVCSAPDRGPEPHTYIVARDLYIGDLAVLRGLRASKGTKNAPEPLVAAQTVLTVAPADMSRVSAEAAEGIITLQLPEAVAAVA